MSELHIATLGSTPHRLPSAAAVFELFKPVTWFPPMWAFMCGAVSSGAALHGRWPLVLAGAVVAGPAICATSQAVNDWFDRHVDAINEPHRPIPRAGFRAAGVWGSPWYGRGFPCCWPRPWAFGSSARRRRA